MSLCCVWFKIVRFNNRTEKKWEGKVSVFVSESVWIFHLCLVSCLCTVAGSFFRYGRSSFAVLLVLLQVAVHNLKCSLIRSVHPQRLRFVRARLAFYSNF